jgi:hypothetical protein
LALYSSTVSITKSRKGIGVILATISFPIIAIIWPGPFPRIFDAGFGIGSLISALMAPIPFLGLMGWLVGQLIGWTASSFRRKAAVRLGGSGGDATAHSQ